MQNPLKTDEFVLHDHTTTNATGNTLNVRGWGAAVFTVAGDFSASITLEASSNRDGGAWFAIPAFRRETGKSVHNLTVGRFLVHCRGLHKIRACISEWEFGEVTITGRPADSHEEAALKAGSAQEAFRIEIPSAITQIGYPAYMVNRNWDIEWINDRAEQLIFGRPIRKITNIEERHFFKLLFVMPVRQTITDFELFVKSHLPLVQGDIPSPSHNPMLVPLGTECVNWLERIWPKEKKEKKKLPPIDCRKLSLRFRQAAVERYHRVATSFREGTLIIWIPGVVNLTPVLDLLTGRQEVITDLLLNKLPALQSMAVMVADLQSSVKICADLPPEEYFELITDIWARLEEPFRRYGGTSGRHVGDGVVRYFLAKRGDPAHHTINALLCADVIRQCMGEIDASWKSRKNWLNTLVLNIGLHEGREWFGYLPTLPAPEFTALGDTVNIAGRLSGVARDGTIWVTKHFLSSLPEQVIQHIVYGIRRPLGTEEHLMPRTYSRVLDLPDIQRIPKFTDIANLSVTQVIRVDASAIQEYLRAVPARAAREQN